MRCEEQVKIVHSDNIAIALGGAIYSLMSSNVFFTQYSTVLFINNSDKCIYTNGNSSVTITANATVTFNNNTARWYGGVPYSNKYGYSDIAFDSNAQLLVVIQKHYSFVYNKAVFVMLLTMY